MREIGGYFGLELNKGSEYYPSAIKLNSGRHCLEYILLLRQYSKVWIPFFTCDVILQPIEKLGLVYEFYHINECLEPLFDFDDLSESDGFIYTNYFGMKDRYIQNLPKRSNIIIDNSQAFYSKPISNYDTFYSPRKFFGVPDGGYLFTYDDSSMDQDYQQSISYRRFSHLLKRLDLGAEKGYRDFKENDNQLSNECIMKMSSLTQRILSSINYEYIIEKRINNFNHYHQELASYNLLPYDLFEINSGVPLVYPLLIEDVKVRERLISKKIFVAQYWPNVIDWTDFKSIEHCFASNILALPVDQRIGHSDVDCILDLLSSWRKK